MNSNPADEANPSSAVEATTADVHRPQWRKPSMTSLPIEQLTQGGLGLPPEDGLFPFLSS